MRKPVQHRDLAGKPAPSTTPVVAATATVSFERDIRPIFAPFAAAMMWRFDLTNYTAVMANAQTIYDRIKDPGNAMPPPPFPMLTAAQIQQFDAWMKHGCQP